MFEGIPDHVLAYLVAQAQALRLLCAGMVAALLYHRFGFPARLATLCGLMLAEVAAVLTPLRVRVTW